jgi:starvation-inducible DNA-binding protein
MRRVAAPVRSDSAAVTDSHVRFPMNNLISRGLPESTKVDQEFGELRTSRIGLPAPVRIKSVAALNRLPAHTMALRDLYKKAHWQISGPTFHVLHRLFDKHEEAHLGIVDLLPLAREAAERGDDGTNDVIVGAIIRTNELQSWFLGEHLAARQSE